MLGVRRNRKEIEMSEDTATRVPILDRIPAFIGIYRMQCRLFGKPSSEWLSGLFKALVLDGKGVLDGGPQWSK